jgi:hypothetical protein
MIACRHDGGLLNFLHSRFVSLKKSDNSSSSLKILKKERKWWVSEMKLGGCLILYDYFLLDLTPLSFSTLFLLSSNWILNSS